MAKGCGQGDKGVFPIRSMGVRNGRIGMEMSGLIKEKGLHAAREREIADYSGKGRQGNHLVLIVDAADEGDGPIPGRKHCLEQGQGLLLAGILDQVAEIFTLLQRLELLQPLEEVVIDKGVDQGFVRMSLDDALAVEGEKVAAAAHGLRAQGFKRQPLGFV